MSGNFKEDRKDKGKLILAGEGILAWKRWTSSLDKRKRRSLWIVKWRQVKQFLRLIRRWSSESSYWGVFFLYKEGISSHESKESEATESGNLRRGEISLWKIETELNRKKWSRNFGKYFWFIWSWQPFNNLEINSRIRWLHFVNPALSRAFPNSLLVRLLPICLPYLFPLKYSYFISFDSKIRINFN